MCAAFPSYASGACHFPIDVILLMKREAEKEGQAALAPSLEQWLEDEIFASQSGKTTIEPTADEVQGFETFTERYRSALPTEKSIS